MLLKWLAVAPWNEAAGLKILPVGGGRGSSLASDSKSESLSICSCSGSDSFCVSGSGSSTLSSFSNFFAASISAAVGAW
ncbi:hypothetical protein OGAPHI_006168 [Ogataea philodendri]|uniref:Uncharacterized protein n=1 Tax=Ogataea philodendri TaxID=1378263 RepID=A0A9P8NYT1_9ASCO|nr:uncharacterized protein OGAPHI_006168 [Ogataea philodendri]KAH3661987.1 hypothetical protein OGAPHI_006168 [Ogataea philodendri]